MNGREAFEKLIRERTNYELSHECVEDAWFGWKNACRWQKEQDDIIIQALKTAVDTKMKLWRIHARGN
jgi:hypothetical protein